MTKQITILREVAYETLMLFNWLLTIESFALTTYTVIGEIQLARLDTVPVNWAVHLIFMWTFTLMSWAFVIAAWSPWRI